MNENTNRAAPLALVILAAGQSRRLGFPKQLCQWRGQSLLERAVRTALLADVGNVYVVLGARAEQCRGILAPHSQLSVIYNPDFAKGIGSTIRCAVRELRNMNIPWRGILFCVCDQFFLSREVLQAMSEEAGRQSWDRIVAASYAETWGTPVYLPARCFDWISSLDDDEGVKSLTKRFGEEPLLVPFPDGQYDLDQKIDMEAWDIQAPDDLS